MEEGKGFKDIELGAGFAYKGVIHGCRLGLACEDCVFDAGDSLPGCVKPLFFGACSSANRHGQRDVIFVETGEGKPAVPKTEFALDEGFQCGLRRLKCARTKEKDGCSGCFFEGSGCPFTVGLAGDCRPSKRGDGKDVVFVEVKPENKQE